MIFLLLSALFISSSVAQLDVTKFSKTLYTLARDGLGTATLQVSHLPNTLLIYLFIFTESFKSSLQVFLYYKVEPPINTDTFILRLRGNGRNIVDQKLPTLLDVTCCVRLHTLLHVVGCCCLLLRKV